MKTIKIILCFSLLTFSFDQLSFRVCGTLSAQSWQWAIKDSSSSSMYPPGAIAICVDSSGNSYIAGVGDINVSFNSCGILSNTGWIFGFIAKYDMNGNCVWVKSFGGYSVYPNADAPSSIAIDKHGNLLITGVFCDSAYFGSLHLVGVTGRNMFVAKYDNNGNIIWAKGCPCGTNEGGNGISVDKGGNVYVVGTVNGAGNLGSCVLSNGLLLTKLDSNGNCIWAKGNANRNVIGSYIKTDSIGNSYICGTYTDTAIFGMDILLPFNGGGGFIAKYDSSGNCLWAKADYAAPKAISIDKWDDVYIAAGSTGKIYFGCDTLNLGSSYSYFIAKFDMNGNCLWDKPITNATPYALHVNHYGNSFITGSFTATASLGSCSISTSGSGIFVTRLDSAGNCIWTQLADGNSNSYGIDCDHSNNCYIIGGIYSNTTFGSITLTNSSPPSILVAKLDVLTGIVEVSHSPITFNIYPNPSAGGYNLDISASLLNSQLTIYDTEGRSVFQVKLVQQNPEINIPSLAKGMYYVKLITPQGQSIEKTIVQQ